MGAQKNWLNVTVLFSTQIICSNLWVRKYLQFYVENFCLSVSNVGIEAVKKESKKLKYNFEVQHVVSP